MLKLYEMADSGNCYKVRLLLHQLAIDYERIGIDILKGESRTREFLELNPNGKVPLLVFSDGRPLAESNAMLIHLAHGTPLLPEDPYDRAIATQWLFFEQYSHEPFIATNRFWRHILREPDNYAAQIQANEPRGYQALDVMENNLADRPFFAGASYSIADIGLYAYTHVAGEGGFDLGGYANVRAWLERVASQPRHIPIDHPDV